MPERFALQYSVCILFLLGSKEFLAILKSECSNIMLPNFTAENKLAFSTRRVDEYALNFGTCNLCSQEFFFSVENRCSEVNCDIRNLDIYVKNRFLLMCEGVPQNKEKYSRRKSKIRLLVLSLTTG